MKAIFTNKFVLILVISLNSSCIAQSLRFPTVQQLENQARANGTLTDGNEPDSITYLETDFDPPSKGKIMKADVKNLSRIRAQIAQLLESAPNKKSGKLSNWHPVLVSWNDMLSKTVNSGLDSDLLNLLPNLVAFTDHGPSEPELCSELLQVSSHMTNSGHIFIRALANRILHFPQPFDTNAHKLIVAAFTNSRLIDETAWDEDDRMPLDSAGVFILNPGLAVEELKKRPVDGVKFFMTGVTESAEFFRRYVEGGDGLAVLKDRYAANKGEIEAKHRELVTWLEGK